MATEVLLVKAGMTMTEGSVAEWYVPDGGTVEQGQPLYRMETEKIELEVEADASGYSPCRAGGRTLEPEAHAYILGPGELPRRARSSANAARAGGEHLASTIARRLARERGIPLASVTARPPGRVPR